jgi:hypothetical protein
MLLLRIALESRVHVSIRQHVAYVSIRQHTYISRQEDIRIALESGVQANDVRCSTGHVGLRAKRDSKRACFFSTLNHWKSLDLSATTIDTS